MQSHGEDKDLTQPSTCPLQVLVLAETETLPWREDVQRTMGHIIGKQLQLGPGGSQAQEAFCAEVMSTSADLAPRHSEASQRKRLMHSCQQKHLLRPNIATLPLPDCHGIMLAAGSIIMLGRLACT